MDLKVPLACVLLVGGALGLAMPFIADESGGGDFAQALVGEDERGMETLAMVGETEEPASWHDQVVLGRERDGHFYADVVIDGVPTRMLVDTGASVIALTGEDAAALGIYWDESEVQPVAQTANGVVSGVHTTLRRVSVGGFEGTNVAAMIIPEGLSISLLGQSFLATVDKVEIAGDQLVLGE